MSLIWKWMPGGELWVLYDGECSTGWRVAVPPGILPFPIYSYEFLTSGAYVQVDRWGIGPTISFPNGYLAIGPHEGSGVGYNTLEAAKSACEDLYRLLESRSLEA